MKPAKHLIHTLKTTYQTYPRQFWLVAFGILFSSAGSSLIWPFQLIYMSKKLNLPISSVASLITISSVIGLAASVLGGAFADRVGRKPTMFIAQAANGLAYILMSLANTYWGFFIPMAILGAAMPFYSIGSDAMMADIIPIEKRTNAYAILRMINNSGIAIGPAIGGFIVAQSYSTAFYIAASAMFSFSLLLLFAVKETLPFKEKSALPQKSQIFAGFEHVISDRSYITFVAAIAIGMIAPLMMWILLSVYMNKYFGIPEYLYSWLPITNALMCVFAQFPVTQFTRRMQVKQAITLGMLVYAVGVGSVALMDNFWGFWFSMVIMTLGELILVPSGSKYVADIAPEDLRGRYMSIYWLTWGVARAAAPIFGGFLHDTIGPQAIWWGGLSLGISSTFILYLISVLPDKREKMVSSN
jgi:MFS family permease